MALAKIDSADYTNISGIDYENTQTKTSTFNYTPDPAEEAVYSYTPDWAKWKGFYDVVPELQAVIDKKAIWTIGRGYKADEKTKEILGKIRGNGKDTFNSIMHNLIRTYTICGDAFAEIIRNARGELINLKPISPGTMRIVASNNGIITRYEHILGKNITGKQNVIKFKPKEIFHLCWNRLADAPHGISTIAKLQEVIEARQEAVKDLRTVFHRYVKPLWIFTVDTDDTTEIATFKSKLDKTIEKSENLVVPKDTVANIERVSIPQYSTLDPLPWLKVLQEYFLIAEGVPEVILGYGRETTEASSKILYLAFQQMVEFNQDFNQEQIKAQLKLDVEFEFPVRIDDNLKGDQVKDGKATKGFKKSDVKLKL